MPGKVEVSVQINRLSGHGVAAIDDFCQTRQLFGGGEAKFRVGVVVPAYIACAVPRFISGGGDSESREWQRGAAEHQRQQHREELAVSFHGFASFL